MNVLQALTRWVNRGVDSAGAKVWGSGDWVRGVWRWNFGGGSLDVGEGVGRGERF